MPQGRARWLSSRRRRRPSPPSPQRGATALPAARSSPRRARRSRKTSTSSWTRSTTSWRRTPRSSSRATCSGAASNECRSTSTAASSASRSSRSTSPAPRPSSRVPAAPASRSCASYRSSASKPPARSSRPPCRAAAAAAAAVPATERPLRSRLLLMDLRRLEIFAKVAELGSFSRAAEALFLTQPTISEHIRGLEDELGVQLLDRLGRRATTTRAGDLMLGYARRLLALSREARQALDQFQGRLSGQLVVGGSTIPGEYLLPALIGQFKAKYPDISISLLIGDSRQVTTWVDEGRAEVGVVGARPGLRTLVSRALMPDELGVVLPADPPWAGRKGVTLADLRREPMIVREQGSGSREALEHALGQANADLTAFRVVGEMGSTQAIKQAVRSGVGISIISRRAVDDECRANLLSCVTLKDLRVSGFFYLITHRDRSRSPLAQAFVHFVESQLPSRASQ